jgi:hypothetical protein
LSTHLGGEGAVDTVPQNGGANVTMIGALALQGLDAMMTVDGATHGDVLRAYVEQVHGPNLGAGDVVMKIIAADLGGCLPLLMQRLDGQTLHACTRVRRPCKRRDTPVQFHRI